MFLVLVDIAAVLIGANDFWLIIPCILFLIVGHIMRLRYMKAKREMMRLYSITKSPISGLTEALIKGSPLIRALNREEYFSNKMCEYIEENNKSGYVGYGLDQWFQQRMAIVAWFIVLIPSYAYVIYKFFNLEPNTDFKYETLVLFVLRTSSLAADYTTFSRDSAELEYSLIAIERCHGFEELRSEPGYRELPSGEGKPENKKDKPEGRNEEHEEILFPNGNIKVDNIVAYYPGTEQGTPVLNGVNVEIVAGEKIGIVGRTGAGKSSFIKLFSRLLIPSSGTITIDGKDISKLDVKHLRHQIMVISQNCSLFEGTLRNNIDPYMNDPKKEEELIKMM